MGDDMAKSITYAEGVTGLTRFKVVCKSCGADAVVTSDGDRYEPIYTLDCPTCGNAERVY